MTIEIIIPQLGRVKRTAKDLVISTLMHEHPLTLIKITTTIKKKFNASVTFQGVRKAVNQLVENRVITKEGKEYSLSKDWILELRQFVEEVQECYFTQHTGIKNIEAIGEDIKVYTFENLIDVDIFWNSLIIKWFDEDKHNNTKRVYVQQSGHTWYVLANLEEETKTLEKIKKQKVDFYTLTAENTFLDQWCKKYYQKHGFYYTNSSKKRNTADYFAVYKDKIIQCTYPKELTKEIDKIYSQTTDFESFDVATLIQLLRKKTEIKITVMKNPVIAEQLMKSILSNFKKKRNQLLNQ